MGEASDRLTDQAKQVGKAQLEKAQQVAAKAKDAATGDTQPAGRPKVIEPARATPLGGEVSPKDPRLGTR